MANEFVARNGIIAKGSSQIEGGLEVTGAITGSVISGSFVGDASGLINITAVSEPAGADGQIQYNNGGVTAGTAGLYWDDVNSRVGIGTTSPGSKLHIRSTVFDDHITLERGSDSLGISPSAGQLLVEGGLSPWNNLNENLGRSDKHWNEVFVYSIRSGGVLQFKSNGNNERMRITADGNVGIGTTSPARKLHVSGDIELSGAIYGQNTDHTYLEIANSGYSHRFFTRTDVGASLERFTVEGGAVTGKAYFQNTKVGVNTANPLFNLHVVGTGAAHGTHTGGILIENTNATDGEPTLAFKVNSMSAGTYWMTGLNQSAHYKIAYGTDFSDVNTLFSLLNTGNVGIGNTAPSQKLDVTGHMVIGTSGGGYKYFIKRPSDSNATAYFGYHSADNGDFGISNASGGGNIRFESNNGSLRFRNTSNAATLFNVDNAGNTSIAGDLTVDGIITAKEFHTEFVSASIVYQSGSTQFGNSSDDTHIFTGSLKLSTGTKIFGDSANPYLHLDQASGAHLYYGSTSGISLQGWTTSIKADRGINLAAGGSTQLFVSSSGNVGIGTTSPNATLHVVGGAHFGTDSGIVNPQVGQVLIETGSGASTYLQMYTYNGSLFNIQSNGETAQIGWGSGFDRTVAFTNTGAGDIKVGIGTASPTGIFNSYISATRQITHNGNGGDLSIISDNNSSPVFYVKGTGTADLVNVFDNNTEVFTILDGGNVGIGTTSPDSKLHVVGTAKFQDDLTISGSTPSIRLLDTAGVANEAFLGIGGYRMTMYTGRINNARNDFYLRVGDSAVSSTPTLFASGSTGYVGIGSEAPARRLHIGGAGGSGGGIMLSPSSGDIEIQFQDSGTTNAYITLKDGTQQMRFRDDAANVLNVDFGTERVGIGTTTPDATLTVVGSGSASGTTIMAVDGTNGRLFEVSDDLSDSLFSVNTVAGLPVIEAFADNTVKMGAFNQNDLVVTGSRVGIGTTSPTQKLSVHSSDNTRIELYESTEGIRSHWGVNSGAAFLTTETNHPIKVYTNSTERMRITSDGNVGIGTTAPTQKLHVEDGNISVVNGNYYLYNHSTVLSASSTSLLEINKGGFGRVGIFAGGSELLSVTNGGNVGIGTTSPVEKLSVNGNINSNKVLAGTNANLAYSEGTGGTNGQIYLNPLRGNRTLSITTQQIAAGDDIDGTTISTFYTNTGGPVDLLFKNGSTNTMILKYNGNVGIGTTSPGRQLHISGSGTTVAMKIEAADGNQTSLDIKNSEGEVRLINDGGTFYIYDQTDSADRFRINTVGNVGIGTSSPAYKLDVNGQIVSNNATAGRISTISGTRNINIQSFSGDWNYLRSNGGNFVIGTEDASTNLFLRTNDSDRLTITSTGNVGIGTTTPSRTLYVNGTFQASGEAFFSHFDVIGANSRIRDDLYLNFGTARVFRIGYNSTTDLMTFGSSSALMTLDGDGNLTVPGIITAQEFHTEFVSASIIYQSGSTKFGDSADDVHQFTGSIDVSGSYNLLSRQVLYDINGTGDIYANVRLLRNLHQNDGLYIGYNSAGTTGAHIRFYANGTNERMRIDASTGNVGIGTTTPTAKLHVDGTWTSNRGTVSINGPANALTGIGITSNNIYRGGLIHRDGTAGQSLELTAYSSEYLLLKTANTTRLAITPDGNVGIGTNSPNEALHVVGDSVITGGLAVGEHTTINPNSYVVDAYRSSTATSGDSIGLHTLRYQWSGTNTGRVIGTYSAAQTSNTSTLTTAIGVYATARHQSSGALTNAYSLYLDTPSGSPTNAFNVYSAGSAYNYFGGNVGIGTTSPAAKLHTKGTGVVNIVESSDTVSYTQYYNSSTGTNSTNDGLTVGLNGTSAYIYLREAANLVFGTSDAERMRITSSGNVGIGTTSPGYKLDVAGSARIALTTDTRLVINQDTAGTNFGLQLGYQGTRNWDIYNNGAADSKLFFFSQQLGASAVTFTPTGNVGIGTANPASPLDVLGKVSINSDGTVNWGAIKDYGRLTWDTGKTIVKALANRELHLGANNQNSDLVINTSGNVGIGTSNPSAKLDIIGNAYIGSTANNNGGAYYNLRLDALDTSSIGFHDSGSTIGAITFSGAQGGFILGANHASYGPHRVRAASDFIVDGNVGIGTTSPGAKLEIRNDDGSSTESVDKFSIRGGNGGNNQIMKVEYIQDAGVLTLGYAGLSGDSVNLNGGTSNAGSTVALNNDGTTKVFFHSNGNSYFNAGNVGIGTTNPTTKIDVAGVIKIDYDGTYGTGYGAIGFGGLTNGYNRIFGRTNTVDGLFLASATGMGIYFRAGGGSTEHMTVSSSGNVGIATTTPSYKLDVNGTIRGGTSYRTSIDGNASGAYISFGSANDIDSLGTIGAYGGLFNISSGNGDISFQFNTTERMRITTGGNVGIGTTSPSEKLQINGGNIWAPGDVRRVILGDLASTGDVHFGSSGLGSPATGSQDYGFYAAHNAYRTSTGAWLHSRTSTIPAVRLLGSAGVSSGNQGFSFDYSANVGTAAITWTNLMQILPTGNVGIGTTSPLEKLHVNGAIKLNQSPNVVGNGIAHHTNGYLYVTGGTAGAALGNDSYSSAVYAVDNGSLELYAGSSNRLHITSGGNVGIGTTSPSEKLHVTGNTIIQATGTGNGTTAIRVNNSAGTQVLAIGAAGEIIMNNSSKISTVVDPTSTQPQLELYNGATGYTTLQSSTSYGLLLNPSGANVGIGTTSPTYKLDVETADDIVASFVSTDNKASINIKDNDTSVFVSAENAKASFGFNVGIHANNLNVDSSGNVGIGTSSPAYKLDVAGTGFFGDVLTVEGNIEPLNPVAYDLGRADARWRIVFCETLDSAGLHEANLASGNIADLATGTVLVWKNGKNVPCTVEGDHMRMGVAVNGNASPLVQGAEPVLVTGTVKEGDYLITSEVVGHAKAISRSEMLERNLYDCVIGKALESGKGESYLLKAWITI